MCVANAKSDALRSNEKNELATHSSGYKGKWIKRGERGESWFSADIQRPCIRRKREVFGETRNTRKVARLSWRRSDD